MTDRKLFRPVAPVPAPGSRNPLRLIRGMLRADFSHFTEKTYSAAVFTAPLVGRRLHMPNNPKHLRRVLVEEQAAFPKHRMMRRLLGPLIGDSMFVTNGEHWQRQRRMVEPTLELSRLKDFFPSMGEAVDDMVARIDAKVSPSGTAAMDIDVETMRVTADILCRTVFSEQVEEGFVDALAEAFREYQAISPGFLACEVARLPYWIAPLRYRRARRAAARIRGLLSPLIDARLATMRDGEGPNDLLSAMIRAEDPETGHRFSARELTDEVAFFFLAGHETSASALSWSFYLLANDTSVQDRVRAEIGAEFGGRAPDFSGLRRLKFTRDVFRETLRLYPPVTSFLRETTTPCQFGQTPVRARDLIAVTPWFVHRSPRNWSHADRFDPDRFRTEEGKVSARTAYIPFNTGPRVCSGAAFATQEVLLVLSAVLSRYEVAPLPEREPRPAAWLTHRSANGVWLRVSRRSSSA